MTPERWARIKGILNAALEQPAGQRRVFLDGACGGDATLRDDVERLLAGEDAILANPGTELRKRMMPVELTSGQMLAHYRIEGKAGEGGMGVVYRGRDTKLGREVALKVLPQALSGNTEYMARFRREAQVLAALNHPNIAIIHELEETAIVMEFIEGVTLAERMSEGAIPLLDALEIARQIAQALEYAHDKGVIHRDLKPTNVKITPDGGVKVLDFGLAKIIQPEGQRIDNATLTGTGTGTMMGSLAYMAPEQASGDAVDWRVDVWAFGVVLYEMLTGHRLFEAGSVSGTLAAVLTKDPDWSLLPKGTPLWVERLLRRCLERDKRKRLRDLGDAWATADTAPEEPGPAPTRVRLPWIVAAAAPLVAALAMWAPWRASQPPFARSPLRLDIEVSEPPSSIAVSPDGMLVVFRAGGGPLLTRRLDQDMISPLAGTEGARDPFFSPDGKWLAFFAHGKIRKLALGEGVPVTVCEATDGRGGSWGEDGYIVAALDVAGGLSRVSANGGKPELITALHEEPDQAVSHRWPHVLPRGKGILFTSGSGGQDSLWVLKSGSTQPKLLLKNASDGRFLKSGHLVYHYRGSLIAAPMDLDRLELTGVGLPLVSGVPSVYSLGGRVSYDLSNTGTLVYVRRTPEVKRVVSWLDSSGRIEPLLSNPDRYVWPRLSPDGKRLAITIEKGDGANVWVYDTSRETMTPMPASGEYQVAPLWTPDGECLVFQSEGKLAWARSDGSGRVEHIAGTRGAYPWSFSSDGGSLFFHQLTAGNYDLWSVAVQKSGVRFGQPRRLTNDAVLESHPAISPDGSWLAYVTLVDSVRSGVFVAALMPDGSIGAGKWQVSNRAGTEPIWSKNRRDLFYRGSGGRLMIVSYVAHGSVFVASRPRTWSETAIVRVGSMPGYDVAPDGKRVVAVFHAEADSIKPETHLRVLTNIGEEIRRRRALGN